MKIANIEALVNDLANGDWRYRQGPDRGARMDGTLEQLHVAISYLELTVPQADRLLLPLRELRDDLIDLHEGGKPDRLRPINRTGQPPTKINETRHRGRKAALMELLVAAGRQEPEAAAEAARVAPAAKASQVEYWRRRARGGDDRALSIVFRTTVATWLTGHQDDPQRAANALKDALKKSRFGSIQLAPETPIDKSAPQVGSRHERHPRSPLRADQPPLRRLAGRSTRRAARTGSKRYPRRVHHRGRIRSAD